MDDNAISTLHSDRELTLFEGGVLEAIEKFPRSLNVAVALAHGTGLWDATTVVLKADPTATRTTHHIAASGPAGEYSLTAVNRPLQSNPATSATVPSAILQGVARLSSPSGTFV